MVFTARAINIAAQADSRFLFSPRKPISPISKAIFLYYAKMEDKSDDVDFKNNLEELLGICGGLPLFLAVVGRRLAQELSKVEDSVRLENLVKDLNSDLDDRIYREPLWERYDRCLYKAVMLSVEFLDKEYAREIRTYSFAQMFRSLSILSKQGWIPISVLQYVEYFSRFSLVTMTSRPGKNHLKNKEEQEQGVMVHDLTLDICRMDARLACNDIYWHDALLSSYLEVAEEENEAMQSLESDCALTLGDKHRAWWSGNVPEDGYIHDNLSRHLVAAGRQKELWSLLLNPEWSKVWIRFGTFLPLQRGLVSLLGEMERISDEMNSKKRNMIKKILEKLTKRNNENDKNLAELQLIYRALRCAWGRIAKCPREYPYQILGRLFDARENMQVVHFFLEKVEESAQKPWLRPLHQCLQDPREGPEVEVYFNSSCSSVAYFPCGKKVAAVVGNEVRVIDLQCGETLATYSGHEEPVRIATVSSNGKWLISADDQDIRVWENEIGRQVGNPIVCENSVEPNDGSLVIRGRSQDLEGSKVLEGSTDLEIFGIVKQHVEAWKPFSERNVLYNIDETTSYIAFSADGRELVCATVGAKVVRVLNMNNMHTNAEEMKCPPECGYVSCLAVSQDAKSITCGTRAGKIVFWDRNSDELQGAELSGHSGAVIALEISKNAQLLLSGSADGGVRMWDLRKREKPAILIGKHSDMVTSLAVSPDGKRLVSASHDRTLRFWDLTKDTCANDGNLHSNCHSGPVTCISSSPDGRFVISGSEDMEVRVWDAKNGKILGKPLIGHEKSIEKVDVSRDSTVVYSYADHVAWCWKMDDEDMEIRTQCPLSTFVKRKYTDKDNNSLSLQKKQNIVVECNYKSADGKEFILAQMPTQKESLQWHIDHVGKVVYVGRQDGTLMVSKVQR